MGSDRSWSISKTSITAQVIVEDKGALDCVRYKSRVKAAAMRATDETINWEAELWN